MSRLNAIACVTVSMLAVITACASPAVTGMIVHMQNQEYEETIHLADSVIANGEGAADPLVWLWRGRAQANLTDWAGAAESFSKTHELDPAVDLSEYWFAFFNAGVTLMGEDDVQGAIDILMTGREIIPTAPNFDLMLGDIELNVNGDLDAALLCFQEAGTKADAQIILFEQLMDETEDPAVADYYAQSLDQTELIAIQALFNAGSIYSMQAQTASAEEAAVFLQQALDSYDAALAVDPTNVDVLGAIADVYMLQADYEGALQVFENAMVQLDLGVSEGWLDPVVADQLRADMLVSIGFAYIEMEDYEQAISNLEAARTLIGDDFIVLATLAHARFVMEEYEVSLDMLDLALGIEGLSPEDLANAYQMEFACYSRMEMDTEAAVAMETALQYTPDNARYWELLASTYSRLGRRDDAIDAMQRMEELDAQQQPE
jgi:tetratricopeptide (TPR) repeat protein